MRWYYPPDTKFEIWALAVWCRARYLSVTEALHNIYSLRVSGEETVLFLWNLKARVGLDLRFSMQVASTTVPGPPPQLMIRRKVKSHLQSVTTLNPLSLKALNIFLYKPWSPKGLFQFEIIINVLVSTFWFIWIPMLWVYDQYKYFNSFSAGINFRRPNLTSIDVRFWRLKSIPAL